MDGERADYKGLDGHRYVDIDDKPYRADTLAWMYVTGEWIDEIEHIDGNPDNIRFDNLRPKRTN